MNRRSWLALPLLLPLAALVAACAVEPAPCEGPCGAETSCASSSDCHGETPFCVHHVCQASPTATPGGAT